MTNENTIKDVIEMVDWAKRIEITYRAIVRIVEQTRRYNITSTNYVSLLNARYSVAKQMLDFNFEDNDNTEYKVALDDTFNGYLSDDAHWQQTQTHINEVLNELHHFMSEFSEVKPSIEIEAKYIEELVKPVNTLLAKYHKENAKPDDVVYELTLDVGSSDYYLNGVFIYHTKLGGSDDVLQKAFEQKGPIKEYVSDKPVNTSSIRGNFNLPEALKRIMIKATNNRRGIFFRSVITKTDILKYGIDTAEVDAWLDAQK